MAGRGFGTWLREGVWEIPLRRYLALLLTLVVLGGLGIGGWRLAQDDRSCAAGGDTIGALPTRGAPFLGPNGGAHLKF